MVTGCWQHTTATGQKPEAKSDKNSTIMEKKDPQVRYSDEDLEEFKALILESSSSVEKGLVI